MGGGNPLDHEAGLRGPCITGVAALPLQGYEVARRQLDRKQGSSIGIGFYAWIRLRYDAGVVQPDPCVDDDERRHMQVVPNFIETSRVGVEIVGPRGMSDIRSHGDVVDVEGYVVESPAASYCLGRTLGRFYQGWSSKNAREA